MITKFFQLFLGQQHAGVTVLLHILKSLFGVRRIKRHICATCFHHREGSDRHPFRAPDHDRDDVGRGMQTCGDAVGDLVQLAVRDPFVAEDNRYIIRHSGYLRFEERKHRLRIIIVHMGLVERIQHGCLVGIQQRNGTQCHLIVFRKSTHGVANRLRETLHHLAAVTAVVVLHHHRRNTIHLQDIESDLELRYVQFHVLRLYCLSFHFVFGKDAELVGVHDFCRQVIVGGYLCKRIVLMREGLLELLACLPNELLHGLRAYLAA